jgi:hypothetical protein
MTNRAILDRCISLTFMSRFLVVKTIKEQDQLLDQLDQGLQELKLRGDQLQLPLEDHAADSR